MYLITNVRYRLQDFKVWDAIANVSDFLLPHVPALKGIMKFRQIMVKPLRDKSHVVVAQFKEYASGSDAVFSGILEHTPHTVILAKQLRMKKLPDCQR